MSVDIPSKLNPRSTILDSHIHTYTYIHIHTYTYIHTLYWISLNRAFRTELTKSTVSAIIITIMIEKANDVYSLNIL